MEASYVRNTLYLRSIFARHYDELVNKEYFDITAHENCLIRREICKVVDSKIKKVSQQKTIGQRLNFAFEVLKDDFIHNGNFVLMAT